MYALLHLTIKSMVIDNYGDSVWKMILKNSSFEDPKDFTKGVRYPEEATIKLIAVVSKILSIPTTGILEMLGDAFLQTLIKEGYKKSLKSLGKDFPSLINNLDSLHATFRMTTHPNLEPPSFRCDDVQRDGTAIIHYFSSRGELMTPFVLGLLKAIGQELFQLDLKCQVIPAEETEAEGRPAPHVTLRVEGVFQQDNPEEARDRARRRSLSPPDTYSSLPLIEPADFCQICPFHIIFDKSTKILQCGGNIQKMCPGMSLVGQNLSEIARIRFPNIPLTYMDIIQLPNAVYLLELVPETVDKLERANSDSSVKSADIRKIDCVTLKGQMLHLPEEEAIIFLSTPLLNSITEMQDSNMYLADIPIYDACRDLVLIKQQIHAEDDISKKLDAATSETVRLSDALEREKKKTDALLYQLLPRKVANTLRDGGTVKSETFDCVTIFFSDIVSFTTISSSVPPSDVVSMLNELYSKLDQLTAKWDVYKVETIGDAYMVVGGAPEVLSDHAERVANFAIDMVHAANQVTIPNNPDKSIQVRTGIHSGPVCAGVVGEKMPRYCLSGDTVIVANCLQEAGKPGHVHVSPTTYNLLCAKPGFKFEEVMETTLANGEKIFSRFLLATPERSLLKTDKSKSSMLSKRKRSKRFKIDSCSCIVM